MRYNEQYHQQARSNAFCVVEALQRKRERVSAFFAALADSKAAKHETEHTMLYHHTSTDPFFASFPQRLG